MSAALVPRVSGALPLSSLKLRALDLMRKRSVVSVQVGERHVCRQDVEQSDEAAAVVLAVLVLGEAS